jgi:hypothetical protein
MSYKNSCNLVNPMWCTYIFYVYYDVLKCIFGYIYRLYYIHDILSIHFEYVVSELGRLCKYMNR